jgi:hypothetical protein
MLHFRHSVLVHAEWLRDRFLFEQRRPGTSGRFSLRARVSGRLRRKSGAGARKEQVFMTRSCAEHVKLLRE